MELKELRSAAEKFDRAELWNVFVSPNEAVRAEPEKNRKAVFNTHSEKVAAIVSDRYILVQHKQVVNSVIDALANLNIKTQANVRDAGNRIFVNLTFPDAKMDIQLNETFFMGLQIVNSYNKTTGVMVLPRLVRLTCLNGMVVSVGWTKGINLIHTNKLVEDFQAAIPVMIKQMANDSEKFKTMLNTCISDSVEWKIMNRILNKLLDAKSKHLEHVTEKLKQYAKGAKPTRWDLYNAFTDYATHDKQIKPNVEHWLQRKAQKVLTTSLAALTPEIGGN